MRYITKALVHLQRILLSGDVDEKEYDQARQQISEDNRKNLLVFSAVSSLALLVMCIISIFITERSAYLPVYLSCTAIMIGIFAAAHTVARKWSFLTGLIMYAFMAFLLLTGIGISTMLNVHETSATYIALVLAVPMLFTDRPLRVWLMLACCSVLYVVCVVSFKDVITWNTDIVNGLLFASLSGIVSTWLMMIKIQRICLEDRVRKMAEMDMLTGVLNRNAYEQRLAAELPSGVRTAFCVYVDVNGLHHMNDTQGHEAGDRMLQFAATTLRNAFGAANTYRIGGDEFLAIGEDRAIEQVQRMSDQFKQDLIEAGYHAAVGCAVHAAKGLNKVALVREAETRMYDDKRDYYVTTGIERRRN